jgi:hypothetical protein
MLYDNEAEEALHQRAIQELAQEVNQPIAGVKVVYEGELARLKSDATITEYLPLFASRRAHEALLRRQA